MKRGIAMVLVGLLVAPSASAGQKQGKPIDWQEAQKLKSGTEIVLTVTGDQPTKVRLLFADEATLLTLKPTAPKLPGGVQKSLFEIGAQWPGILNTGATWSSEHLRVARDGIFDRDKKLAELSEVVQQTPRGQVQAISETPHSHLGRWIAIAAAAAGLLFFLWYAGESGSGSM